MHVVSHATSISCRIVIAVDQNLGPTANRNLENKWNQMALMATVFTEVPPGSAPGGVEVPKQGITQTIRPSVIFD